MLDVRVPSRRYEVTLIAGSKSKVLEQIFVDYPRTVRTRRQRVAAGAYCSPFPMFSCPAWFAWRRE